MSHVRTGNTARRQRQERAGVTPDPQRPGTRAPRKDRKSKGGKGAPK